MRMGIDEGRSGEIALGIDGSTCFPGYLPHALNDTVSDSDVQLSLFAPQLSVLNQ